MIKSCLVACAVTGYALTAHATPAQANELGCSTASYYGVGDGYHGRQTASGERFNAYGLSTAHRSLPFGTKLKVTNQQTSKSIVVHVNDRGPFIHGRTVDLSYGAFASIANPSQGVTKVCITRL